MPAGLSDAAQATVAPLVLVRAISERPVETGDMARYGCAMDDPLEPGNHGTKPNAPAGDRFSDVHREVRDASDPATRTLRAMRIGGQSWAAHDY